MAKIKNNGEYIKDYKQSIKISNDFVNSIIKKNNYLTLKILFFVMTYGKITEKEKRTTIITLDLKKFKKLLNLDFKNLRQNIKMIQKTIITIKNQRNIVDMVLIPKIEYLYEKQSIELTLFNEIFEELKTLSNRFTIIDLDNLIYLKNKHSIRLLTILETIAGYDENVAKVKYCDKEELNNCFGTSYKGIREIERAVLKPVKEELDQYSKLTFEYGLEYDIDTLSVGRKPIIGIKLYLKDNKQRQLNMIFN